MTDSLIPLDAPGKDDLRAASVTLLALLRHMQSVTAYTSAEHEIVSKALDLLARVRPDLGPAVNVKT